MALKIDQLFSVIRRLLFLFGEHLIDHLPKIELARFPGDSENKRSCGCQKAESPTSVFRSRLYIQIPSTCSWILLTGQTGRTPRSRFINVYFNHELQSSQFRIPLNRNGCINEILPISKQATFIELETQEADFTFATLELQIFEISGIERILRMIGRVWHFRADFRLPAPFWQRLANLARSYHKVRSRRLDKLDCNYEVFIRRVELPQIETDANRLANSTYPDSAVHLITFEIHMSCTSGDAAKGTLASLHAQTYSKWTLATKETSESAPADWILPLKAGDILRSDALQQIISASSQFSEAEIIYADHDFMGGDGRRRTPCFKPDWNKDLFLTHNYLAAPCAFRARNCMVHNLCGADLLEESVRYQLILETACANPRGVHHIARILCHRGADPASNVTLGDAAQPRLLQEFLRARRGVVVDGVIPGTTRVIWPLPESFPLATIIIATRDQSDALEICVQSIQANTDYPNWELLIIDNESVENGTLSYFTRLRADARIRIIRHEGKFNYSALQNLGARLSNGQILVFLNNDVEILTPEWLANLVRHAYREDVGAVGARLLYPDGKIQHAGVILGMGGPAGHVHRFFPGDSPGYCGRIQLTQELSAVTAACLAVRKATFDAVGGFDEKDLKVSLNDIDFCLKLKAIGLRNIYDPHTTLKHHESLSRGPENSLPKRWRLFREQLTVLSRWRTEISRDPNYNENLALDASDCSLRDRKTK